MLNQKGFAPIFILIALLVIFTFGISAYFLTQKDDPITTTLLEEETPSEASPTPTDTWVLYTDNTIGYQLEYPSSWSESKNGVGHPDLVTFKPGDTTEGDIDKTGQIEINPQNQQLTPEDSPRIFKNITEQTDGDINGPKIYSDMQPIQIAGLQALSGYGGCCGNSGRKVFFINNGYLFEITLYGSSSPASKNEGVLDHMLQSIKFTQ